MPSFAMELSVSEAGRNRPEYTIDSDLSGEITLLDLLQWTKTSLIVIADEILKEEQEKGFDKEPVLAVDGRVNKPIQSVNPLGSIEFTARADVLDIVAMAYEGVLYRSKVLTGRYKSSNFVFYNGTQIASSLQEFNAWAAFSKTDIKDNDTFRILNIQPYARKLERYGITAQRSSITVRVKKDKKDKTTSYFAIVPNGVYQLTARSVKAKYKRNSSIKFAFISGTSLGITGSFKNAGRGGKKSANRAYLYPSITINVSERGTT